MGAMKDDAEIEVQKLKCQTCKHYIKAFTCKAYDIIPLDIFDEQIEHDKVMKGQKGTYIYEKK